MKILPVKSKVSGLFATHEPIHRAVDLIGHESGEVNIRKDTLGKRTHLLYFDGRFRSCGDASDGDDLRGAYPQAGLPEEDGVDQPEVLAVGVARKMTTHQDYGSVN